MTDPRPSDEAGLTTVEYAVGVVAACGFAAGLIRISPVMFRILQRILAEIDSMVWNVPTIPLLS